MPFIYNHLVFYVGCRWCFISCFNTVFFRITDVNGLSSNDTLTLYVNDVNDVTPAFTSNSSFDVSEETLNGLFKFFGCFYLIFFFFYFILFFFCQLCKIPFNSVCISILYYCKNLIYTICFLIHLDWFYLFQNFWLAIVHVIYGSSVKHNRESIRFVFQGSLVPSSRLCDNWSQKLSLGERASDL